MTRLAIYCADVGSLKELDQRFGWARLLHGGRSTARFVSSGTRIEDLADRVADDLSMGVKVALGFECPLFYPVPSVTELFFRSRRGEGNRPWSVAAGLWALRSGLVQMPWLLAELRTRRPRERCFLDWAEFRQARRGLFLWEAFVSRDAKLASPARGQTAHERDALTGAEAFADAVTHDDVPESYHPGDTRTLSVVAAALLWSGWEDDPRILRTGCLIVKAIDPSISTLVREASAALTRSHAEPVRRRIPTAPPRPGLYAIHAPASVWSELGFGKPPDARPLYVGKAESSLAGRDVSTHFGFTGESRATSVTGGSTLRRSLAALLRDRNGFHAIPRNPAKPGHYSNYGLTPEDDDVLSEWMRGKLRLACWPKPDGISIEELKRVEGALTERLLPPLNLDGVVTPWRAQVAAARSTMAEDARSWKPPRGVREISG